MEAKVTEISPHDIYVRAFGSSKGVIIEDNRMRFIMAANAVDIIAWIKKDIESSSIRLCADMLDTGILQLHRHIDRSWVGEYEFVNFTDDDMKLAVLLASKYPHVE